jgi:hypothetical protein
MRGVPNPIIDDPGIAYGRFKVLMRTDRMYVVHETEQGSGPFRFGPVFADIVSAQWRAWHRAKCEDRYGVRIGQVVLVGERPAELVDFIAPVGEQNLSRVQAAARFRDGKLGQFPVYMIHPWKEAS